MKDSAKMKCPLSLSKDLHERLGVSKHTETNQSESLYPHCAQSARPVTLRTGTVATTVIFSRIQARVERGDLSTPAMLVTQGSVMLLVQCVWKGDGPSWNRGVNFANVAHLHLTKTLDEGVCEPAAVCACGVSAFHSHDTGG